MVDLNKMWAGDGVISDTAKKAGKDGDFNWLAHNISMAFGQAGAMTEEKSVKFFDSIMREAGFKARSVPNDEYHFLVTHQLPIVQITNNYSTDIESAKKKGIILSKDRSDTVSIEAQIGCIAYPRRITNLAKIDKNQLVAKRKMIRPYLPYEMEEYIHSAGGLYPEDFEIAGHKFCQDADPSGIPNLCISMSEPLYSWRPSFSGLNLYVEKPKNFANTDLEHGRDILEKDRHQHVCWEIPAINKKILHEKKRGHLKKKM